MSADDRATIRLELGRGALTSSLVGCVANYLPVKRHDLLIDAFSRIADAAPGARLVLVGEGPMRPAMEAQIRTLGLEERVRLHGSVADPTAMLGAFDVVVQASRSEGLPNALLEAAAAGRPIVATAAGGSGEIVLDGQTGLLVPIDDGDALASALLRAPPRRRPARVARSGGARASRDDVRDGSVRGGVRRSLPGARQGAGLPRLGSAGRIDTAARLARRATRDAGSPARRAAPPTTRGRPARGRGAGESPADLGCGGTTSVESETEMSVP